MISGLLGLVLLIFNIVAIIGVLKSSHSGGKKIIWILVILFLPVLGLVLYYLLGRKQ